MKVADNLSAKRAAATEADGEIEGVDGGDDEDSSDLIFFFTDKTKYGRPEQSS